MTDAYHIGNATPPSHRDEIVDLVGLEHWMVDQINRHQGQSDRSSESFDSHSIDCRRYIADSVRYGDIGEYGSNSGLYQTGCSPNYYGGMWSLACCKHYMRSRRGKFRNRLFGWDSTDGEVLTPRKPLFVFTYGRKKSGHQYLASVAMVTRGFKTMEAYREYLESDEVTDRARVARLTGVNDPTDDASRFGDCHAGKGLPRSIHPHMRESKPCSCARSEGTSAFRMDMRGDHVICVSDEGYWMTWSTPMFETQKIQGQNANGRPLRRKNGESLDRYFMRLLDESPWITEVETN